MNPASSWGRFSLDSLLPGRSGAPPTAPAWLVRGFVGANLLAVVLIATLTSVSLVNSRNAELLRTRTAEAMRVARQSIAEANGIDDPMSLPRGTVLSIPTLPG